MLLTKTGALCRPGKKLTFKVVTQQVRIVGTEGRRLRVSWREKGRGTEKRREPVKAAAHNQKTSKTQSQTRRKAHRKPLRTEYKRFANKLAMNEVESQAFILLLIRADVDQVD